MVCCSGVEDPAGGVAIAPLPELDEEVVFVEVNDFRRRRREGRGLDNGVDLGRRRSHQQGELLFLFYLGRMGLSVALPFGALTGPMPALETDRH